MILSENGNLSISSEFNYIDSNSNLDNIGLVSDDQLQVLRFGVDANIPNTEDSNRPHLQANVNISQGIGGTTMNNAPMRATGEAAISRVGGSAIFTKANVTLRGRVPLHKTERVVRKYSKELQAKGLPPDVRSKRTVINLMFAATTQITADTLLDNEVFALGSPEFGSAFGPREINGDLGYGLRMELQGILGSFALQDLSDIQFEPYAFFDFGQVFRNTNQPLPGGGFLGDSDTLMSAGFGLRQFFGPPNLPDSINLALELGFPLEQSIETVSSDPRVFFTVNGIF